MSLLREVYWVVENKILGMRRPISMSEVNELKSIGVGGIISLLDDRENHKLYEESEINFLWLPVKGGTSPDLSQVAEAVNYYKKLMDNGKSLAVHCSGGKKRTATLIASLLVKDGMSPSSAFDLINKANNLITLNDGQIQFVKDLSTKE